MTASDDPRSDSQLIEAINAGSSRAFEALYRRHRDWVVSLAYRFTGNRADALDVMQETFRFLLGRFPDFELRAKLTTYLYPVVRNRARELLRRRREQSADPEQFNRIIWQPPAGHDLDDLAAMMANLSPDHREVVLLRFVEGWSIDEIAAATDVPPGTVKSRLHHAVAKLRQDPKVRRYFDAD